jgi:hypothetical protein
MDTPMPIINGIYRSIRIMDEEEVWHEIPIHESCDFYFFVEVDGQKFDRVRALTVDMETSKGEIVREHFGPPHACKNEGCLHCLMEP